MKAIRVSNLTDFYVADKTFFLLKGKTLFRNTECLGEVKSGKLTTFYVPTSSAMRHFSLLFIFMSQLINVLL